jgi:F-type H+-transporting ATPase subunit b
LPVVFKVTGKITFKDCYMLYFKKLILTSTFIINVKNSFAAEAKTGLPQLDLSTYPSLMFWSITSLIIGYILMKYLITPNIKSILNSRETNIQNDLVKAKTSNQEAEKIKQSIIKSQDDIRSKSQKIIYQAILESKQSIEKKEKDVSSRLELQVAEAEKKILTTQNNVINEVISNAEEITANVVKKFTNIKYDKSNVKKAITLASKDILMEK